MEVHFGQAWPCFAIFCLSVVWFCRQMAWTLMTFLLSLPVYVLLPVQSKIVPFTFLTSVYTEGVCASIGSHISSGSEIIILGLNNIYPVEARSASGKLFGFKINPGWYDNNTHMLHKHKATILKVLVFEKYVEAVEKGDGPHSDINNDDIVLFTDGSDVLFNSNLFELERLFDSMEENNTVLVNGETTCFPKWAACYSNPLRASYSKTSPFQFANSGCWMARWEVAKRFIALWAEYIRRYSTTLRTVAVANTNSTDQGALHMYARDADRASGLTSPSSPRVRVDSGSVIFQTTLNTPLNSPHWMHAKRTAGGIGGSGSVYIDSLTGKIRNTITNTEPVLLHFNGVTAKKYVKAIATHMMQLRWKRKDIAIHSSDILTSYYHRYPELKYCEDFFRHVLSTAAIESITG